MFEVTFSYTYSGVVFLFETWEKATTFVEFVLGCGHYMRDGEVERLTVSIAEVEA